MFKLFVLIGLMLITSTSWANPGKLLDAYPDQLKSFDGEYIIWKDGTKMLYNDGIQKTFDEKLSNPDLEDQISIPYIQKLPVTENNQDPGRIRFEPFFKKMYGSNALEIEENLETFVWMPNSSNISMQATTVNGISYKLDKIGRELDKLSDEIKEYVLKPSGSFYWRTIKDTNRLSMHSFGIAFDIDHTKSEYWLWDKKNGLDSSVYRNTVPLEIVKIFEKHGFIWGGYWQHYDTMHFEYRPELLN